MDSSLEVKIYATKGQTQIAHLLLNKPKSLNALDLPMAEAMLSNLIAWKEDDSVSCIVISGNSQKAFCAGGDVVSLYHAMSAQPHSLCAQVQTYFEVEYTLDYTIRTYPKPIIVWGQGIVIGGGLGLLSGASHRVLTPSSTLAMPEVTIGLYPDVGASYFLPRMPGHCGEFIGMTGALLNATDAHFVGLADYICQSDTLASLLSSLSDALDGDISAFTAVTDTCTQLSLPVHEHPAGNIIRWQKEIDQACHHDSVDAIFSAILAIDNQGCEWLNRAQTTMQRGSPLSIHLVHQQCRKGIHLSLADCFRMELVLSCRSGEFGEFREGVRALLVDKDKAPKWRFNHVKDVPAQTVARFFSSPWLVNPLATLQ